MDSFSTNDFYRSQISRVVSIHCHDFSFAVVERLAPQPEECCFQAKYWIKLQGPRFRWIFGWSYFPKTSHRLFIELDCRVHGLIRILLVLHDMDGQESIALGSALMVDV